VKIEILQNLSSLYGCETWSLAQGEIHRWRVFENRVFVTVLVPKGREEKQDRESYIMGSFIKCALWHTSQRDQAKYDE
jgi:hypothetical protein